MSKLYWDTRGSRFFETGIDRCVLYPKNLNTNEYDSGVAWNGVTSISDSDGGYQPSPIYANNKQYLMLISQSSPSLSLSAYTYPEEFSKCEGSLTIADGVVIRQQNLNQFGISYRTLVGNDELSTDYGYQIHLVYGCIASPSERSYSTINESPEVVSFNWNITPSVEPLDGFKPTAIMIIDSRKTIPKKLKRIEKILYGSDFENPRLPSPNELFGIMRINPLEILPINQDEEIAHITTHEVQSNITVWSNTITGVVKPLSWVFDPFSFEIGITEGKHYYLALDFSSNDFEMITSCYVYVREDSKYDVFTRSDHKVLIEIDEDHPTLFVVQKAITETYTQIYDLSYLVFSDL